jgi:hypothetical protein
MWRVETAFRELVTELAQGVGAVDRKRKAGDVIRREFVAAWLERRQHVQRKTTAKQICADRFEKAARELTAASNSTDQLAAFPRCPF